MNLTEKLNLKITKITLVISGTFIILILQIVFNNAADIIKIKHEKKIIELSDSFALEEKMMLVERDNELKNIYGESPEQICKNPSLNIKDLIGEVTRKTIKPEDSVKVSVDNFIEYDVAIKFKNKPDIDGICTISKTLLSYCNEYVNSINFYFEDNLVCLISKKDVDKVKNWKIAELSTIKNLVKYPM